MKGLQASWNLGCDSFDSYANHPYDTRDGLVVLINASETHRALILCQAQHHDIAKGDSRLLRPKPMVTSSGKFVGGTRNWHITQKEFFPSIVGLDGLDFIPLGHPTPAHLMTDHRI